MSWNSVFIILLSGLRAVPVRRYPGGLNLETSSQMTGLPDYSTTRGFVAGWFLYAYSGAIISNSYPPNPRNLPDVSILPLDRKPRQSLPTHITLMRSLHVPSRLRSHDVVLQRLQILLGVIQTLEDQVRLDADGVACLYRVGFGHAFAGDEVGVGWHCDV